MSVCIFCHICDDLDKLGQGQIKHQNFQLAMYNHYRYIIDRDLWMIANTDNVNVHHLLYLWWPWEIMSRSNRPSRFSSGHISLTVKDTGLQSFPSAISQ